MLKQYYDNNETKLFRESRNDVIAIHTETITRSNLSFKEECCLAAARILETNKDISLGLTGGWLSHIILESFLSIGYRPKVFIVEFHENLNAHDVKWAKATCELYGIVPQIIPFTPSREMSSSFLRTSADFQIYSYYENIIADVNYSVDGLMLIAEPINIRRDVSPAGNWSFIVDENKHFWPRRYNLVHADKKIINRFFTSSPEILLSFLELPTINQVIDDSMSGKISITSSRNKIFNEAGFTKSNDYRMTLGTMFIPDSEEINSDRLKENLGYSNRECYLDFKELKYALKTEKRIWRFV
jgi:hypothetical protein